MSGMRNGEVMASAGNGKRNTERLLTKAEACRELGVSLSTLDRRIASGAIQTKKVPLGRRHRVYVVAEENTSQEGNNHMSLRVAFCMAQERIRGLEEQVRFLRDYLLVEQERRGQLLEDLRAAVRPMNNVGRQRRWWCFGNQKPRSKK